MEHRLFVEIADMLEKRGVPRPNAAMAAGAVRKPRRAVAYKEWMAAHPQATKEELEDKAVEIARTVDPTARHRGR